MRNNFQERDRIVFEEDFDSLFLLDDNSDFSIALHEILIKRHKKNPSSLNSVQLNLFLCMHLENAGQADSILSFLQEWFPEKTKQIVKSLKEIRATKSSEIIKQATALLPRDGSWFFTSANQIQQDQISELDSLFSSYPDGSMGDLYRRYAEEHRSQIEN